MLTLERCACLRILWQPRYIQLLYNYLYKLAEWTSYQKQMRRNSAEKQVILLINHKVGNKQSVMFRLIVVAFDKVIEIISVDFIGSFGKCMEFRGRVSQIMVGRVIQDRVSYTNIIWRFRHEVVIIQADQNLLFTVVNGHPI